MIELLLALLPALPLALPPASRGAVEDAQPAPPPPAAGHLRDWLRPVARGRVPLAAAPLHELRKLLDDVQAEWPHAAAEGRRELLHAALEAHGVVLQAARDAALERPQEGPSGNELAYVDLTRGALRALVDDGARRHLQREVLLLPRVHPLPRRLGAAEFVACERVPDSALPLFHCARNGADEVSEAALRGLAGWDDPAVHAFFVDVLVRGWRGELERDAPGLLAAERHFSAVTLESGSREESRLGALVATRLTAKDWRRAAEAVVLSRALADARAVPALIDAMQVWIERGEDGHQARRVQGDLAVELRRRSGRNLGTRPDRWRLWWAAVQRGEIPSQHGGEAQVSVASFFGIRPVTDRVTFVIDRSGSMDGPYVGGDQSRTGHTRYDEAREQLVALLESLGEDTRFNVVLFSDGADRWRTRLQRASPSNLRAARDWLAGRRPRGGTYLRNGLEEALHVRSNGEPDLDRLEADTVIVLCDGETHGGPAWVRPFLERVNRDARVVVHCVQLGPLGDGVLQLLAEETGGDFVTVQG